MKLNWLTSDLFDNNRTQSAKESNTKDWTDHVRLLPNLYEAVPRKIIRILTNTRVLKFRFIPFKFFQHISKS